jgi:two-component system sensor histidine kinase PilS (NtrC family)
MERATAEAGEERALARVERTYLLARAVVAVGLVLAHAALAGSGVMSSRLVWLVILVYTVQTLALRIWGSLEAKKAASSEDRAAWKPSLWRIVATLGVDFVTFAVLHSQQSGANFNFAALLVLPVLMAGVLLPRRPALAVAAAVTLSLLAMAWHESLQPGDGAAFMQTGLAGVGLFVIAWIGGELAGRLLREERVARANLALARQQSELSRLVIDEMGEGVVVIDRLMRLRALNPAARSLLGLGPAEDIGWITLRDRPAWAPLSERVQRAFAEGVWPDDGREIMLDETLRPGVPVRVRVRLTRRLSSPETAVLPGAVADLGDFAYCVLFLEDGRAAHARLQQEKLAAMGRVSAGIAHEIRNPLAAIAQANALLTEDTLTPPQQRLAGIVADNVRRLQRIVDDVLAVVPGREEPNLPVDAAAVVRAVVEEWCAAQALPLHDLRLEIPETSLTVTFDPEHLRRVVINLLDNAQTHASGRPGSIALQLSPADSAQVRLIVSNDGPAVAPGVAVHLFEPFFSTRSRGSGLGLYICRELCSRHGARIEHQGPRTGGSGAAFVVTLRRMAAEPSNGYPGRAHPSIISPSVGP